MPPRHGGRAVPTSGYAAEWAAMRREYDGRHHTAPRTADEFAQQLSQRHRRNSSKQTHDGVVDRDVEDKAGEATRQGWAARALHVLCVCIHAHNPQRVRRRLLRLYWHGWWQLTQGVLLSCAGTLLLLLSALCACYTDEHARAVALLVVALLLCVPGYYSVFTLLMYLRGQRGYSYTQLP